MKIRSLPYCGSEVRVFNDLDLVDNQTGDVLA